MFQKMVRPYSETGGRLPGYVTAGEIVAAVIGGLRPPERLTVEEAATRWRKTRVGMSWRAWDPATAPYMREPQEIITSRRYRGLVFCGPAQSLKTSALMENAIAHAIMAQPRAVHLVQMDRISAQSFSEEKIAPMIAQSPDLAARQKTGRRHDAVFTKSFLGDMRLTIGWPTASSLSSRAIPLVLLTDYDRFPESLDGQGPAWDLARNRPKTFGSLGMVVAESSPSRDVVGILGDDATIHAAPPCGGILGLYPEGTRARLYWRCTNCGEQFEPTIDRLKYDAEASPFEAGRSAVMVCPDCGFEISPAAKAAHNAAAQWLHESEDGREAVPLADPRIRRSDVASYWMQGAAAALSPWADIVSQYVAAKRSFDQDGDAESLRAVLNTQHGLPFKRPLRKEDARFDADMLRAAADDRPLGIAPAETLFILASVDVQIDRFVVNVEACGAQGRRWMIDRFDLSRPPATAPDPGGRRISPATCAEDWAALDMLETRAYEVAGSGAALRIAAACCDSGGAPGTTDNAYSFWRAKRDAGRGPFWHLIRPRGGVTPGLAWIETPKRGSNGRAAAVDVPLLYVGTDRAKDAIASQVVRAPGAVGAYRLTRAAPPAVFREITAEARGPKGAWALKPGEKRNEALDLAGYCLALSTVLLAGRRPGGAPPAWMAEGAANSNAVPLSMRAAALPEVSGEVPADAPGDASGAFEVEAVAARSAPRGRRRRGGSRFISR
jgi:phage terminase large subunit GpA-like protein